MTLVVSAACVGVLLFIGLQAGLALRDTLGNLWNHLPTNPGAR